MGIAGAWPTPLGGADMAKYGPKPKPPEERLWAKVRKTETCWLWTGGKARGYGFFTIGSKADGTRHHAYVHRFVYELLVGPIPEGMTLDHLCHNADRSCPGGPTCLHRRCVNPAHLEPATMKENGLRGGSFAAINARKTHCKHGHEFTPENTYFNRKRGRRTCKTCRLSWQRRRRERLSLTT